MIASIRLRALLFVASAAAPGISRPQPAFSQQDSPAPFPEMQSRMIGPFRGGRVLPAVDVPGQPNKYFFGAVGGGVWKTENADGIWQPIFDAEPIASIGAIAALSPQARGRFRLCITTSSKDVKAPHVVRIRDVVPAPGREARHKLAHRGSGGK